MRHMSHSDILKRVRWDWMRSLDWDIRSYFKWMIDRDVENMMCKNACNDDKGSRSAHEIKKCYEESTLCQNPDGWHYELAVILNTNILDPRNARHLFFEEGEAYKSGYSRHMKRTIQLNSHVRKELINMRKEERQRNRNNWLTSLKITSISSVDPGTEFFS